METFSIQRKPMQPEQIEARLGEIWRDLLALDHVEATQDFIAAGGDSQFAMRLIARIWDDFEFELSPGLLYDHPSIRSLSKFLASRS